MKNLVIRSLKSQLKGRRVVSSNMDTSNVAAFMSQAGITTFSDLEDVCKSIGVRLTPEQRSNLKVSWKEVRKPSRALGF